MLCVTFRQPWAYLILNGYKDVENRTWEPKYKGTIIVHSAKKMDPFRFSFPYNTFYDIIPNIDIPFVGTIDRTDRTFRRGYILTSD